MPDLEPDPTGDVTAKRVFELFVGTLETERDAADANLLIRLRWYAANTDEATTRLADAPRAARALMSSLGDQAHLLELEAAKVDVMEENLHQARRWALLLPEVSVLRD